VTPLAECVGNLTALRAFSVCSPEGRYLGSRRPICKILHQRFPYTHTHAGCEISKSYHRQQPPNSIARLCADTQPVLRPAHIELDVFLLSVAGRGADGGLGDWVVGSEDFEGFGVARGAVAVIRTMSIWVLKIGCFAIAAFLPGVCEDDVVARGVSAAAARCGDASEAEFEDHLCCVVWCYLVYGMRFNAVVSKSPLSLPMDYSDNPNPCCLPK
jgi:hypothetical protein